MSTLTQSRKRRLRELVDLAYRRELARELDALEADFGRRRAGEIDVFELNERIHQYHNGPARDLWKLYANVTPAWLGKRVASAVASEVLSEADLGPDITEALAGRIAFFRAHRREDG